MPVQDPRQLHQAWEKAYHDGDVDALVGSTNPTARCSLGLEAQ
jgi:hypothetical protein